MIRVIYSYHVSQSNPKTAGETTTFKLQLQSMSRRRVKQSFLVDLTEFIGNWRDKGEKNTVILFTDMSEYIGTKGELFDFSNE